MSHMAAHASPPPVALTEGGDLATAVEFIYDPARFISFRDAEVCARLSAHGRARAEAFTPDAIAARLEAVYRSLER